MRTDASDQGLGAVLLQEFPDGKFPIAYVSRKLLAREKNYPAIEREGLAIVWAIKKFEGYLYGNHFVLEIDPMPLIHIHQDEKWKVDALVSQFTATSLYS